MARTYLRLGRAKLRLGSFAAGGLKRLGRETHQKAGGLMEAKETFKVFKDAKEACIISNSMTAPVELVPRF